MNAPTTETRGDYGEYRACVDVMRPNDWIVRKVDDETILGILTEHITVNFDGDQPPHVRWSWTFDPAESARLDLASTLRLTGTLGSTPIYGSWLDALRAFAVTHTVLAEERERRQSS